MNGTDLSEKTFLILSVPGLFFLIMVSSTDYVHFTIYW